MPENRDTPQGLGFALTAYVLWGFLPLYMKLLSHIPPAEVVAHRVIWSLPIAATLLIILRSRKARCPVAESIGPTSVTDCSICIVTSPPAFTEGRTFNCTPVSLYSTDWVTLPPSVVSCWEKIGTWSPTWI